MINMMLYNSIDDIKKFELSETVYDITYIEFDEIKELINSDFAELF